MVGMSVPFASFGTHAEVEVSQYWVAAHCASVVHAAGASQVLFTAEHAPLRHTVGPVGTVHGPLPVVRPQRLSVVSQTPAAQTEVPTAVVQVPFSAGS